MKFLPVLLVLLLIPLSRALFYLVVWIFRKKENTENKNGIEIANRMLARTGLRSSVNVLLAGDKDCYGPANNTVCLLVCVVVELITEMKAVVFVLSVAAFTYVADIINCIYLIVKIILVALAEKEKNG